MKTFFAFWVLIGLNCSFARADNNCSMQIKNLRGAIKALSQTHSDAASWVNASISSLDSARSYLNNGAGKTLPYGAGYFLDVPIARISAHQDVVSEREQELESQLIDIAINLSGCIK